MNLLASVTAYIVSTGVIAAFCLGALVTWMTP